MYVVRGEAGMECLRGSCGEENCLPLIREEVVWGRVRCEGGGVRCEGEEM